jgi:predicted DCC family thiol-disulfide oxidoreductase YuxK
MRMDKSDRIKIFVDGNCIVCSFEISHYKRMAPELFDIINIADPSFKAATFGLTPEAVNKHMHVATKDGELLVGVRAFAHIWKQLKYYRWASGLILLPGVYQIACVGYEIFARNRHLLPKRK